MKKLNITKKQYDESKYFNRKYGSLKYVSESGKLYKTSKGVVLALESDEPEDEKRDDEEVEVTRGALTEILKDVVAQVEKVADKNDVSFDDVIGVENTEAEEEDQNEVVADGEDLAKDLGKLVEKIADIAEDASVELPVEVVDKENESTMEKECLKKECLKKECGKDDCLKKEARLAKVRESIRRRRNARKVMESVRRRARIRRVAESRRAMRRGR